MHQRERRTFAQKNIARDAATNTRDEAQAENAGKVETRTPVASRSKSAAKRTKNNRCDLEKVERGRRKPGRRRKRKDENRGLQANVCMRKAASRRRITLLYCLCFCVECAASLQKSCHAIAPSVQLQESSVPAGV